jgi:hypothetical protein
MPDQKSLLRSALAATKKEQDVINFWLDVNDAHPFGTDAAGNMHSRLNRWSQEVAELLFDIEDDLKNDRLAAGWEKYTQLCRDHLARLSNELLAVIGGMYLMRNDLDSMSGPGSRPLSFSAAASQLLADLAKRADRLTSSILIVGEERPAPTDADIIRLRFPAVDIWSLPFTAHEYGFLVAHKDPPPVFREMSRTVSLMVDPTQHRDGVPPPEAACYLPEVQQFWDRFYEAHQEATLETAQLDDEDQHLVARLAELQQAHLCRLFADAFATFFVGPAWVHALLHLRFRPDETLYEPIAIMPSFTSRFVFALETLRWMHEDSPLYRRIDFGSAGPFGRECVRGAGLDYQWLMAVQGAGCKDAYAEVAEIYQPWLKEIHRALELSDPTWPGRVPVTQTYERWRAARDLEQKLTRQSLVVKERPHPWAVLNAAWSVRAWGEPDVLNIVERNSIRLLDQDDNDIVDSSAGGAADQAPGRKISIGHEQDRSEADERRNSDVSTVRRGLRGDLELMRQFEFDVNESPQKLPDRGEIFRALRGDQEAYAAYSRLVYGYEDTGRG